MNEFEFEIVKNGVSFMLTYKHVMQTKIKFSKVNNEIFYKKTIDDLTLIEDNAKLIIGWYEDGFELCDNYKFNVYRKCSDGDFTFNKRNYFKIFEGVFDFLDFEIDLNKCIVSLKVTEVNDNDCWVNGSKEYYNVIPDLNKYSVEYFHYVPAGGGSPSVVEENFILLSDVITLLANKSCNGIDCIVSDFFQWNPENPSTINYVTGATSEIGTLLINQFTNIINPSANPPAFILNLSLYDMLQALKIMFNVYARVENGCLRIEHESYFRNTQTIDLFNSTNPNIQKQVKGNKSFSFTDEDFYIRESLVYGHNVGRFGGFFRYTDSNGIPFPNCGLGRNEMELPNTYVDIFDVAGFNANYATRTDGTDAYFIVNTELNTNPSIDYKVLVDIFDSGLDPFNPLSFQENGHLTFYSLYENYHRDKRSFLNGIKGISSTAVIDDSISFDSTKTIKKGQSITIPFCCDTQKSFFPESFVKIQFDEWGEIDEFEFDFINRTATLNYIF